MNTTLLNILVALACITGGAIMFIYRKEIGSFTGYYTGRGGAVDNPTPGCLLIPFALVLIVIGIVVLIKSVVH